MLGDLSLLHGMALTRPFVSDYNAQRYTLSEKYEGSRVPLSQQVDEITGFINLLLLITPNTRHWCNVFFARK